MLAYSYRKLHLTVQHLVLLLNMASLVVTIALALQSFLASKYAAAKRFGLEGAESLIPGMKALIDRSAEFGVNEICLGMPHRGGLYSLMRMQVVRSGKLCTCCQPVCDTSHPSHGCFGCFTQSHPHNVSAPLSGLKSPCQPIRSSPDLHVCSSR